MHNQLRMILETIGQLLQASVGDEHILLIEPGDRPTIDRMKNTSVGGAILSGLTVDHRTVGRLGKNRSAQLASCIRVWLQYFLPLRRVARLVHTRFSAPEDDL